MAFIKKLGFHGLEHSGRHCMTQAQNGLAPVHVTRAKGQTQRLTIWQTIAAAVLHRLSDLYTAKAEAP